MTVVDRAVEKKRDEAKEARRGRGRASDEYWCVIDVDQHPKLGPAVEKAIANDIGVAVSNPCVELWFILHFQDQAAEIDRKRAQAISKELLKCDKVLDERALQALDERFPAPRLEPGRWTTSTSATVDPHGQTRAAAYGSWSTASRDKLRVKYETAVSEFLLLSEGVDTVLRIPPGASVAGCRPRFRPGPCVFYQLLGLLIGPLRS